MLKEIVALFNCLDSKQRRAVLDSVEKTVSARGHGSCRESGQEAHAVLLASAAQA